MKDLLVRNVMGRKKYTLRMLEMRLIINNGVARGFSKNTRTITERDMLKGSDIPKKLGVTPFVRELRKE